jgi:hypothetical protein
VSPLCIATTALPPMPSCSRCGSTLGVAACPWPALRRRARRDAAGALAGRRGPGRWLRSRHHPCPLSLIASSRATSTGARSSPTARTATCRPSWTSTPSPRRRRGLPASARRCHPRPRRPCPRRGRASARHLPQPSTPITPDHPTALASRLSAASLRNTLPARQ